MAGFDDLIERLLHEVALTGTHGLSASQFATIVRKYYEEKNPHVTESTASADDDLLFSTAPPTDNTTVDDSLFDAVLEWLCKHPEVEIAEAKSSDADRSSPDTPSPSPFRQKLAGRRIFVSEDRVWQTLADHGVDHKRIPPREFALLSVVAAAGPRGILQPYAGKLTDQDKRSVPKRTDMLAEKGYIVKQHVIGAGTKTTVLKLKRWTTGEQPLRSIDHPMTDPDKGGNPVIFYDAWYNATMRALKENRGMIAMKDLRLLLGTNGRRWERKVLMRCINRITESGLIRRMTAKYHDKYGAPIRVLGTQRECSAHAIQLLREPTEQDCTTWRSSDQSIKMGELDSDEDESGMEDFEGVIVDEAEQGAFLADANPTGNNSQHTVASDEGIISDDTPQAVIEDEADAPDTNKLRTPPQWTPALPLVNVFHRLIDGAGQQGVSATDLGTRMSGPSWRRPIDQNMLLLTDVGQYSQPAHLKHLAIVRDTAVRDKFSHYRYRTRRNFDKAVAAGEAVEQPVTVGRGKQKADDVPTALDEWGFPRVLPKDLTNRDGRATLIEGRRDIQYELVDKSDHEDERENHAAPARTAALARQVSGTTVVMDGTAELHLPEPDMSTLPVLSETSNAVRSPGLKAHPARAVLVDVTPKPTRTPKPTFRTRDLAPPARGKYVYKRGPNRRRRPDERPIVPLVKKREIPQYEYDEYDQTAEAMAERQVLVEMRASRKRSAAEVAGSNTPATSRKAARLSLTSPSAERQEIDLADLPSDRVAEVKEEILARQKPGVYINPPGARTTKIENFIQLGRPRKALIAVVKTDQLKQYDWFHEYEPPRFAPKASKRRTSCVGNFSKAANSPELVEDSESVKEDDEKEEEAEYDEEQVQLPSVDNEDSTFPVPSVEVEPEHDGFPREQPTERPASLPRDAIVPATSIYQPPAKQRQLRPPSITSSAQTPSRISQDRGFASQETAYSVFSAKPDSAMDAQFGSTPRVVANAVDNMPHQDLRVTRLVETYEQRQQDAARGLAAALAQNEAASQTRQTTVGTFGLDGHQDKTTTRKSDRHVPYKRLNSASIPPEDLVADDEFETVASMIESRPRVLEPHSDEDSTGDSEATDEWVPIVPLKSPDRVQSDPRLLLVSDAQATPSASVETTPAVQSPSNLALGKVSPNVDASTSSRVPVAVPTAEEAPMSPAVPLQPGATSTQSAMPMTQMDDIPVRAAIPVALSTPHGDEMTPAQELKRLMAKAGRRSKATHARMAELNRQIEAEKATTPRPPKAATPPPRAETIPVQTHTSSWVATFDKAYVNAHPDEKFHHRGKGRWARGPRDFQIRNVHVPATLRQDTGPATSDDSPMKFTETTANNDTAADTADPEPSAASSVELTTDTTNSSSGPLQTVPVFKHQTFSSQYVEQHPDEDFYHRGQGRWIRGLPAPGSSGRTGVRGPGAQAWKMSVLGYGVSVQPKKQSVLASTPTTPVAQGAELESPESLIVKLPLPERRLPDRPSGRQSTSSNNAPRTPLTKNSVRPYSTSSLQIVRPYSSYSNPVASPVPSQSADSPATSPPGLVLRTPAVSSTATPSTTPSHTRAAIKSKYQDFPAGTSDDKIFGGDPDLIAMDNLYRLAQRYTMTEIVDKINTGRPEPVASQPNLSNRLARAISDIATRHNKPRDEVVNELRMAQQANGVPKNGRRRKPETLLKSILKKPRRQFSAAIAAASTSTEPAEASFSEIPQQPSESVDAAGASVCQAQTPTPSLKLKRGGATQSEAISADSGAPSSSMSDSIDTADDVMPALSIEPAAVHSGHDIEMTDAPDEVEASSGQITITEVRLSTDQKQDMVDPSVSLVEDSSNPSPRPTTNKTNGTIKADRRKIILDAVRACHGVFPGDNQLWYVSATIWQRLHGQEPDRRTIDNVLQELIAKKQLKRMVLKFRKNSEEIVRHIITEPGIDKSSPLVMDLQQKIMDSHPFVYLPLEADISEERRAKSARRYWKDDGGGHTRSGGTGTGRQPMMPFVVQQTKEAAEAEDREAREQGFQDARTYRQHRDALALERRAKAAAKSTPKTRRKSSASQVQQSEKAAMTVDEDADPDADWELDDQNDVTMQNVTPTDQHDLDYAALELAESRIPSSSAVHKDLVKKSKSKAKPRSTAQKSAVRRPLSSIRPSGLGTRPRRARDVDGCMTLDDMARHHRRAAALMLHPDQFFAVAVGTFGTASIVTEDEVPETRRLRPRPVAETRAVTTLGKGRLIAEFSVLEDVPAGEGQGQHSGVCNLQDVLRHAQSIAGVASLGESDTKTDQFYDDVDRVWYWEMQQAEQVNLTPIKVGTFINHSLNRGHTRVTHQALRLSHNTVANSMSDTVSAPAALVRLKVPTLVSLGLPPGESGTPGNGREQTVELSKATGRPKRKYTSRKRKHQDVEEDVRDSDPEFVPGVEKDTTPPPTRTRATTLKGNKTDIGLAPQRDRKSGKDFKDGNRLVIAFALVAAVCGGINQDHPNWNLIAHTLSYRYDSEFLRRRWVHLRKLRKGDADRFRDALHEPFLKAYEKDELPEIDFQNLTGTDWPTLFEWAESTLAPLQTAPKDDAPEAPSLLESRDATLQDFTIEEPAQIYDLSRDDYFTNNTDLARRHLALRYNYGTPLLDGVKSTEMPMHDTMLLQSWVRAVALTKQAKYNSNAAGMKIKQVASNKVLAKVTNSMIDCHFLVQERKGRHLPGRNFHIHDEVLKQFRRWPAKPEEHRYLRMVAHAWFNLNGHFHNNDSVELIPSASDPEYLVLENMVAQGLIEMKLDLPEVKWDFDAPGPKLSPWGYGGASYETKKVQVQNLRFGITYTRTPAYTFHHGLKAGVPIPLQPAPVPGESGVRIPFWVDIHGNLVDDVWDMVLRSVLHLIVFRPGTTATSIQKSHGDKLWAWEIELMLQWMEEVGIAERWGAGEEENGIWKGGYRASGWWYCAFLPEIATWQAPMKADYGLF